MLPELLPLLYKGKYFSDVEIYASITEALQTKLYGLEGSRSKNTP